MKRQYCSSFNTAETYLHSITCNDAKYATIEFTNFAKLGKVMHKNIIMSHSTCIIIFLLEINYFVAHRKTIIRPDGKKGCRNFKS